MRIKPVLTDADVRLMRENVLATPVASTLVFACTDAITERHFASGLVSPKASAIYMTTRSDMMLKMCQALSGLKRFSPNCQLLIQRKGGGIDYASTMLFDGMTDTSLKAYVMRSRAING